MRVPEKEMKHSGYFRADFYLDVHVLTPSKGPEFWYDESAYYVSESPNYCYACVRDDKDYSKFVFADPEHGAQWVDYVKRVQTLWDHVEEEMEKKATELGLYGGKNRTSVTPYVKNTKIRPNAIPNQEQMRATEAKVLEAHRADLRERGFLIEGENFVLHYDQSGYNRWVEVLRDWWVEVLRDWMDKHKEQFPEEFIVASKQDDGSHKNYYHGRCASLAMSKSRVLKESVLRLFHHENYQEKNLVLIRFSGEKWEEM